jgi:NADH:ubiquinone oxidoreductase subunit 6 (subunit J)
MILVARLALSVAMIAAAVAALRTTNLIRAAIALALGNSSLALLFFLSRAPYAGAAQLSVGAGVMTTLFILAVSLTESVRGGPGES